MQNCNNILGRKTGKVKFLDGGFANTRRPLLTHSAEYAPLCEITIKFS